MDSKVESFLGGVRSPFAKATGDKSLHSLFLEDFRKTLKFSIRKAEEVYWVNVNFDINPLQNQSNTFGLRTNFGGCLCGSKRSQD